MSEQSGKLKSFALAAAAGIALLGKSLDSGVACSRIGARAASETGGAVARVAGEGRALGRVADDAAAVVAQEAHVARAATEEAGKLEAAAARVNHDVPQRALAGARRGSSLVQWVKRAENVSTGADVLDLGCSLLDEDDDAAAIPPETARSRELVVMRVDRAGDGVSVSIATGGEVPVRIEVPAATDPAALGRVVRDGLQQAAPRVAQRLAGATTVVLRTSDPATTAGDLLAGKQVLRVSGKR